MEEEKINKLFTELKVLEQKLIGHQEKIEQYQKISSSNLEKAETSMNKRLETMNEIREQLNQQAATFATGEGLEGLKTWVHLALDKSNEKNEIILNQLNDKFDRTVDEIRKAIKDLADWKTKQDGKSQLLQYIPWLIAAISLTIMWLNYNKN